MDAKETLWRYLQSLRDAVAWKTEGVAERELRMPMTASGTNLLGLVKHLAGVEAAYFGECLGRPWPEPMPWWEESADPDADMWDVLREAVDGQRGMLRQVPNLPDVDDAWRQRHLALLRETAEHSGERLR